MREFISPQECQTSYNPLLMALLWNALATRDVRLLADSLRDRLRLDPRCAWVNYVRSHDDIGWTFDDADAARLGTDPRAHRRFLNAFYTGRFPGSFARGLPFQENPRTGDARICGTTASLAGLERALHDGDTDGAAGGMAGGGAMERDLAIRRILLLYGVALTIGGIPLLYLGDELGQLNDYTYARDPAHADDSRWVHRPAMAWSRAAERGDPTTVAGHVFGPFARLIALRQGHAVFAGSLTEIVDTGNDHVFGFVRRNGAGRALLLANVTERPQRIAANVLRLHGLARTFADPLTGDTIDIAEGELELAPYRLACLLPRQTGGDI